MWRCGCLNLNEVPYFLKLDRKHGNGVKFRAAVIRQIFGDDKNGHNLARVFTHAYQEGRA